MANIVIALDTDNFNRSKFLIDELIEQTTWFKVGMEAYFSHGEELLNYLEEKKANIFLDLKLHDIPVTVSKALTAILKRHPVDLFNVHCLGGSKMMKQSSRSLEKENLKTKLLGVTILTAHSKESIASDFKIDLDINEQVKLLAMNSIKNGCTGIVCSPHEIETIKAIAPKDFAIVTPGVRFFDEYHDQSRVMSPSQAAKRGATHIVIGREVTKSKFPKYTLSQIKESL